MVNNKFKLFWGPFTQPARLLDSFGRLWVSAPPGRRIREDLVPRALRRLKYLDDHRNADLREAMLVFANKSSFSDISSDVSF